MVGIILKATQDRNYSESQILGSLNDDVEADPSQICWAQMVRHPVLDEQARVTHQVFRLLGQADC